MQYNFKKIMIIFIFIQVMMLSIPGFARKNMQVVDKIIAVVNSQVITQSQLNQQIKFYERQHPGENISASILKKRVFTQLINEALQLELAKKAHLTVTPEMVDQIITGIARQNNITVQKLLVSIKHEGLSEKDYRTQIEKEMLLHEIQKQTVAPTVKISDQDIQKASQQLAASSATSSRPINTSVQYHIVDILFSTQADALRGKNKLQKNLSQLHTVKSIQQFSSGQATDLGIRRLSQFPDIFALVIQNLSPRNFSLPIKAPNGYHILLLVESSDQPKNAATPLTAEQLAYENNFNIALTDWLQKLRRQSYVKIMS